MARAIDLENTIKELEGLSEHPFVMTDAEIKFFLAQQPTIDPVKQEWISVKDQPPELGERVFVCGIRGGVNIGKRHFAETDNIAVLEKSNTSRSFTHWMPLPKPPTKKGK